MSSDDKSKVANEEDKSSSTEDDSVDELSLLRQELEDMIDKFARSMADLDNYKKRIERDREQQNLKSKGLAVLSFLEVVEIIDKASKSDYPDVFLYAPYQSLISELAIENDIKVYYEVFLDRNYNNDLSLVSRENDNSMILDSKKTTLSRVGYASEAIPDASIEIKDFLGKSPSVISVNLNELFRAKILSKKYDIPSNKYSLRNDILTLKL